MVSSVLYSAVYLIVRHCSLVIPKCIFIPEGEGVVEEEWEGRCLPCCLEAILDAAAQ
jgi:hypothetical protein